MNIAILLIIIPVLVSLLLHLQGLCVLLLLFNQHNCEKTYVFSTGRQDPRYDLSLVPFPNLILNVELPTYWQAQHMLRGLEGKGELACIMADLL